MAQDTLNCSAVLGYLQIISRWVLHRPLPSRRERLWFGGRFPAIKCWPPLYASVHSSCAAMERFLAGSTIAAAYLLLSLLLADGARNPIRLPSDRFDGARTSGDGDDAVGTRWAVLIAGSNGFYNYRHQVCVCFLHRSSSSLLDCYYALFTKSFSILFDVKNLLSSSNWNSVDWAPAVCYND